MIDRDADTCSLTLVDERSSWQGLPVNDLSQFTDVPIEYMTCDAFPFGIFDLVVVEMQTDWTPIRVLGFPDFPRPCEGFNFPRYLLTGAQGFIQGGNSQRFIDCESDDPLVIGDDDDTWQVGFSTNSILGVFIRKIRALEAPSNYQLQAESGLGEFVDLEEVSVERLPNRSVETEKDLPYWGSDDTLESAGQSNGVLSGSIDKRESEPTSWGRSGFTLSTEQRHESLTINDVKTSLGSPICTRREGGAKKDLRAKKGGLTTVHSASFQVSQLPDLLVTINIDGEAQKRRYVPVYYAGENPSFSGIEKYIVYIG